jgi:hypothetical protein
MPEVLNYVFDHKELAEILIKKQDIHEGHWLIYIEFGFAAANVTSGPDDPSLLPSAIVPVRKIGIQKVDQPNQLSVDASIVNPLPVSKKKLIKK